jgi:hypothetical protein
MITNLDKYKDDLNKLLKLGQAMELDLNLRHMEEEKEELTETQKKTLKELSGKFEKEYQRWYTESTAVIKQLIPDRSAEFEQLYRGDGKRKSIDLTTFHIQDWMTGVRAGTNSFTQEKLFNDLAIVAMRFHTQLQILGAVQARFESMLFDIRQLVQADVFDSELEAGEELLRCGYTRAAGAIAGVILEQHLAQVAKNHSVTIKKKDPSISDLNDTLKAATVYDVAVWRGIQRLADIRNLCDHNKSREPTKDEVEELIRGVDKCTKTLF